MKSSRDEKGTADRSGALHSGGAAGCLSRGPTHLYGADVWSVGADGYVDIFDGVSDQGTKRIRIYAADKVTFSRDFSPFWKLETGLYVKPSATTTFFTVHYKAALPIELTE